MMTAECCVYTLCCALWPVYNKTLNRRRSFTFHEEIEIYFFLFLFFIFLILLLHHISTETTLPLEFNRKMLLWLLPIGMEWWHLPYLAVAGNLNSVTEYFEKFMHFTESFTMPERGNKRRSWSWCLLVWVPVYIWQTIDFIIHGNKMPAHTFSDPTFYILVKAYLWNYEMLYASPNQVLIKCSIDMQCFEIVRKRTKMESQKRTRKMIITNTSLRMNDDDHQLYRKIFVENYTRPMHDR